MENSILVIDDNPDIRENTAEILELAGYKTFMAENGKKGLELARLEKPSLILCDIMMPEMDGYVLLHLVRENPQTENIPFIFLSAKSGQSSIHQGNEKDADGYISKPYEEKELLHAVDSGLKKALRAS